MSTTTPPVTTDSASRDTALPSIFVSHGSPMLALEPGAAGAFMKRLGPAIDAEFGRPKAIVAVSPHTAARAPIVMGAARHHAVHDFGGFPQALFELQYDPPGDPALAQRVERLLQDAGIAVHRSDEAGLDHGIWSVLRFAWPDASIPVLPLALVPSQAPALQWRIGEALSPLRTDGVLVLGTGSITHNLRLLAGAFGARPVPSEAAPEIPESHAFREWVADTARSRDRDALLDYRQRAPYAAQMHPTDEHWLPFYIAAGAGGLDAPPQRLHDSVTYGALGMDAYAFGDGAQRLSRRLSAAQAR